MLALSNNIDAIGGFRGGVIMDLGTNNRINRMMACDPLSRSAGEGGERSEPGEGYEAPSASGIVSSTASVLARISLFQKRRMRQPWRSSHLVRSASASRSAC